MPLQQFTAYDLIVDVIPGVIGVAGLAVLAPASVYDVTPSAGPLITGVGVLIGGYFAGRIIHSVSGQLPAQGEDPPRSFDIVRTVYDYRPELVDWLREALRPAGQIYILDRTASYFFAGVNGIILTTKRFLHRLSTYLRLGDSSQIDDWLNDPEPGPSEVDLNTLDKVRQQLASEMGYKKHNFRIDGRAMRKYGESILYGENTLYNKYELLSTFFRNMTVLAFFLTLLAGIYTITGYTFSDIDFGFYNPKMVYEPQVYLLLTILASVVALAGRARKPVFERRRDRAFVYDLHQLLK